MAHHWIAISLASLAHCEHHFSLLGENVSTKIIRSTTFLEIELDRYAELVCPTFSNILKGVDSKRISSGINPQTLLSRGYFRMFLATLCALGNPECDLGNQKRGQHSHFMVLVYRSLSVPWSACATCKFREQQITCYVSIWHQATTSNLCCLKGVVPKMLK